jgi:hypothetical protein
MAISRVSVKDDNELQKIVANDVSVVEEDLTVICSNMPIDTKTNIDVLCHDESGQLVILKLSTKENDNMFFEGLKNLAYVNNVKPMLKFSYKDYNISDSKTPRLVFLAPSFSTQLVDVVAQMQGIQMDLYTWEYFEFDDKKALHLEPVWLSEATKSKPRKPKKPKSLKTVEKEDKKEPEKKAEKVTEEVVLPPDEAKPEPPKKEQKEKAKKKSIFSI